MSLEQQIRSVLRGLHYCIFKTIYPPGHYYSPIVSRDQVLKREAKIFNPLGTEEGIDFHQADQLALINELVKYYGDLPFTAEKKEGLRYYYVNPVYGNSDAIFLYSILRHFKPRKAIEVGSGFSSAVMLD